jgi:hypothetical protein
MSLIHARFRTQIHLGPDFHHFTKRDPCFTHTRHPKGVGSHSPQGKVGEISRHRNAYFLNGGREQIDRLPHKTCT